MRELMLFVFATASLFNASGQYSKTIEADRPGEGKSAFVQSFRSLQAELGFQKSKEGSKEYLFFHPEFTFRYGINNWLEARMQSDIRTEKHSDGEEAGLKPLRVGVKALLTQGAKILPHISLLLQAGLPFLASTEFRSPHVAPDIRFLFQNEITDNLNITYNIGAQWDGFKTHPEYIFSISPEYLVAEKLQLFAELYSFIEKHEAARTNVDAGLGYLITDDMKVDVNAGWGLSKEATDHFYAVGLSVRIR